MHSVGNKASKSILAGAMLAMAVWALAQPATSCSSASASSIEALFASCLTAQENVKDAAVTRDIEKFMATRQTAEQQLAAMATRR